MLVEELPSPLAKRYGLSPLVALFLWPLVGAVVGWMVGSVLADVSPKLFESRIIVQIHGPMNELPIDGDRMWPLGTKPTPNFVANEFKVIIAPSTLRLIVERLDLSSRWNMDRTHALLFLQSGISADAIEGTDLVSIRVRSPSPEDARDIAREIPKAYVERRTMLEVERAQKALTALDAELRDQEDLVEEKRKVLDSIVQAVGIPYLEGATSAEEFVRKIEGWEKLVEDPLGVRDYMEAKRDYESGKALLDGMERKHVRERINLRIPRTPITVHEEPVIGEAPVASNNVMLQGRGIVSGGLAGLAIGGVAFLLSRCSGRKRPPTATAPAS